MSQRRPSSDGFRIARPAAPDEPLPVDPASLSRYDLLLASIPLVLLLAWVVGQVTDAPAWAALATGSLVVLPLLADGIVIDPPT